MGMNDKNFHVDTPAGMSTTIKLDSKLCARVQINATNLTRTDIDGRGVLMSYPAKQPPDGAVEKKMITFENGVDTLNFGGEKDQLKSFTLKIQVPQNSAPGDYSFQLHVVNPLHTDWGGDTSPILTFNVPVPAPKKHIPWLLIGVIAAVVLLIGGVTTWLLTRGTAVPDLTGKTVTEAVKQLTDLKLGLDQDKIDEVESTVANSGKIVSQDPKPGKKVSSDTKVHIAVGTKMVSVPRLIGHTFAEAQAIVSRSGLGPVTSTTGTSPDYSASGIVFAQTPNDGQTVKSGTGVSMQVTPQTVPVQSVLGLTFPQAVAKLQSLGLRAGTTTGNTSFTVTGQSPSSGVVPVGTEVNLVFPCPPLLGCYTYNPAITQRMYVERLQTLQPAIQIR